MGELVNMHLWSCFAWSSQSEALQSIIYPEGPLTHSLKNCFLFFAQVSTSRMFLGCIRNQKYVEFQVQREIPYTTFPRNVFPKKNRPEN